MNIYELIGFASILLGALGVGFFLAVFVYRTLKERHG